MTTTGPTRTTPERPLGGAPAPDGPRGARGWPVQLTGVGLAYGDVPALADVDLRLPAGRITGLLGRNGAGKTSLLSLVAAFRRPSVGTVLVDDGDPFEDARRVAGTTLLREACDLPGTDRVTSVVSLAADLRPTFARERAEELLDAYGLRRRARVQELSRGARSALAATLGIAARSPVTLLDEVTLGMDAAARDLTYRALLEDYAVAPRTLVLSTHLVDEAAGLFEDVVVLHRGRVLVAEPADDLRGRGVRLTGPADVVADVLDRQVDGRLLDDQRLGRTRSVALLGHLGPRAAQRATDGDLDVAPLGLQELLVHLTGDAATDPASPGTWTTRPTADGGTR